MVIIFLLIILTMFFVAFHNEIGSSLPQGLKPVFVIIIFLLIVACPCLMLRSVIIPNATQVGSFNNNHEEKSIYQENDTKKYFITETNPWNPWNPVRKEYLDTIETEQYIEKQKELQSLIPTAD